MDEAYVLPRPASIEDPLRIAVLISGGGSGLAALLQYQESEARAHQTVLVLADSQDAGGLEHGRSREIETHGISLPQVEDKVQRRQSHEELVHDALVKADVELVVLSGYMRILTPSFVRRWKGRLVNIHPSLLPKYPGAHAHRDALADGATVSGCTVHLVDEGVDSGMILAQSEVPILADDTESDLQERIKKVEHVLYPEVLDRLAVGEYSA
ncbi:MAG: phosphoribosylglycinamide formyltransferase [Candidatus Thalassarchaeum sp.]|nr:phosphoribosylglycinamide formyltransferase [Candidatus Thalassarchaeum sp.]MEC8938724.1 phosphoribosylglycinamide formyltransferase [Candidatus Thermoplasmatota archaeon]